MRQQVIESVSTHLDRFYVYPELAKKMSDAIRSHAKQGDYNSITDADVFASRLTEDLRAVSRDKHLTVDFSPEKLPASRHEPTPEDLARMRTELEHDNCGFEDVRILPRNIGYLKFNYFGDPAICGPTAVAAMNFLAYAHAIIFDLRENGGGDAKMVAFISSYLFKKRTHLNDLYNRKDNETIQFWTMPYVPGTILSEIPAYVLTSADTFSGAEEFTYNLKNLKRATIVGETTGAARIP